MLVWDLTLRTKSFPPRGMTRSMCLSRERREPISCRETTSWIEALGTSVEARASDTTVEMVLNVSVDSLPPAFIQRCLCSCQYPE